MIGYRYLIYILFKRLGEIFPFKRVDWRGPLRINISSTRRYYPDVSEESLRFYGYFSEIIIPRYSRMVDRRIPLLPSLSL